MPTPDYSGQYNTALSPQEEAQFNNWAAANHRSGDTLDYDLRGAWKADAKAATNGHLPDTWKKPNHPTFSQESMYSTDDQRGGQWIEGPDKRWTYLASPFNLQMRNQGQLQDYFRRVEPDSGLVLPPSQGDRQQVLDALFPVQ